MIRFKTPSFDNLKVSFLSAQTASLSRKAKMSYSNLCASIIVPTTWIEQHEANFLLEKLVDPIAAYYLDGCRDTYSLHFLVPTAYLVREGGYHVFKLREDFLQFFADNLDEGYESDGDGAEDEDHLDHHDAVRMDQDEADFIEEGEDPDLSLLPGLDARYEMSRISGYVVLTDNLFIPVDWAQKYKKSALIGVTYTAVTHKHVLAEAEELVIDLESIAMLFTSRKEHWFFTEYDHRTITRMIHGDLDDDLDDDDGDESSQSNNEDDQHAVQNNILLIDFVNDDDEAATDEDDKATVEDDGESEKDVVLADLAGDEVDNHNPEKDQGEQIRSAKRKRREIDVEQRKIRREINDDMEWE